LLAREAPGGRSRPPRWIAHELTQRQPHRLAGFPRDLQDPARPCLLIAGQPEREHDAGKLVAEQSSSGPRLATRLRRRFVGTRALQTPERPGSAESECG